MLKGMKDSGSITMGEIQLSRSIWGKVVVNDTVDFVSKRLNCDCNVLCQCCILSA